MIHSRITSKSQTTVPLAVRRALHISAGDDVLWEIEDGRAYLMKAAAPSSGFVADTSLFTEWADELDSAYDEL